MSVSFLLQCDSESDIDDKVRLLFLCLFTHHMKWLRVVNNKFELSTKVGRQCVVSRKKTRGKRHSASPTTVDHLHLSEKESDRENVVQEEAIFQC